MEAFEQAAAYVTSTCNEKRTAKFLEMAIDLEGTDDAPMDEEDPNSDNSSPGFKIHAKLLQLEVQKLRFCAYHLARSVERNDL